jgi:hypothetical protein
MKKSKNKEVLPYDFVWEQLHVMDLDATNGSLRKVINKFNDGTFKRLTSDQIDALYLKSYNDKQFRAAASRRGYIVKEANKTDGE